MSRAPQRTDITRVQKILFSAMRRAAKHVAHTNEGMSLLTTLLCEVTAAAVVEMSATGIALREPGGEEVIVRAAVDMLESLLRENIAALFKKEAAETRQ